MHSCCQEPSVTLNACVKEVCPCHLIVCDLCQDQEIFVHTAQACCFRVGDRVCIEYNGAMTRSLPPQITADRICKLCGC